MFCFKEMETVNHLFSSCEVTQKIWESIIGWMGTGVTLQDNNVDNLMLFGSVVKGRKRRGIKHLLWLA